MGIVLGLHIFEDELTCLPRKQMATLNDRIVQLGGSVGNLQQTKEGSKAHYLKHFEL